MPEELSFNSYYRSANVFLSYLAYRILKFPCTTNHDPELYSDKNTKQVTMFRNPHDCIPSLIFKRRVDNGMELPTFSNSAGIEGDIVSAAKEYIYYIEKAKENFDTLYVGHFETMIQDPIYEMKKIAKFFNLELEPINDTFENIYDEIKKEMFIRPGPVNAENLMSPHDGHMPREKIETRLAIEKHVKDYTGQIISDCYDLYLNMNYTKVE